MKDKPQERQSISKAEMFAKRYQALCEETGYRISVFPQYIARDDGTWSTTLTHQVAELPKLTK